MRILIDTNIFIDLEKGEEISRNFAEFNALANKHSCPVNVHPLSIEDLKRDKNSNRHKQMISKMQKYPLLDEPPLPDKDFIDQFSSTGKTPNDKVDNHILFAIFKNCADILVTEDQGIHKKALKCGLQEKVFYLGDAIGVLQTNYEKVEIEFPNIDLEFLYNVDLKEEIFDSLRKDYKPFDKWFGDCQKEHRQAWTCRDRDKKLKAILIYKDEAHKCDFIDGKVLKISTFKVGDDFRGKKIGELFIKKIFTYCVVNKYDYVYLTVWPKHEKLIELMSDFGFTAMGKTKDGEDKLVKSFKPPNVITSPLEPIAFHKLFSPYFMKKDVRKFIVPITPEYHAKLFPETRLPQQEFNFIGHQTYSNAIKKAYLCHAHRELAEGDLLLFYRSQDHMILTTLGIVEKTIKSQDPTEILSYVFKRTVFSEEELKKLCDRPVLVILFRQILHLKKNIPLKRLRKMNLFKNNLETITKISDEGFECILSESNDSIFAY